MTDDIDVFEYDSIADLEQTIETVYERQMAFRETVDTLTDQAERLQEYRHDPERFRAAAEYVSERYGSDGVLAPIAERHARQELEEPERADNWDRLQEAVAAADEASTRLRQAHEDLWATFGYTGDAFTEVVQDRVPFLHFLRVRQDEPQLLYDQEQYQGRDREDCPTLGRWLVERRGYDEDRLSRKQRHDVQRGERLDQLLDPETDREPGWMWSEDGYREVVPHGRWVDETEL